MSENPSPPPLRVIVAEDDADSRMMMAEILTLMGCEVVTASDASEAIAACSQGELAFIDIGLPDADGYTVATEVSRSASGSRPYLVALTGHAAPEDRIAALKAGFDNHMAKPISFSEIEALVKQAQARALRAIAG